MRKSVSKTPRRKYAAKLLFQFRVEGVDPNKPRTCEEQIVLISADSARDALEKARRRGERSRLTYQKDPQRTVSVEFLGVRELLRLDEVCKRDEVWYDIVEHVITDDSLTELIPPEHVLEAFRNE